MNEFIKDIRKQKGLVWSFNDLRIDARVGGIDDPWHNATQSSERWLDEYLYKLHHNKLDHPIEDFGFDNIQGRFATAHLDTENMKLSLGRDWIGEVPFHVLITNSAIYLANTIRDIQLAAGDEYEFRNVFAFPHAHFQEFNLAGVQPGRVASSIRPEQPELYYDFRQRVRDVRGRNDYREWTQGGFDSIKSNLKASISKRAESYGDEKIAVLLSGGLDSFSIALLLKFLKKDFVTYTLAASKNSPDVVMAKEFSKHLEVEHIVVDCSEFEPREEFRKAIVSSECYHLFNVYCAVGMNLLAKRLKRDGITCAFCGEGVNEAVGDYQDWIVKDPQTDEPLLLQKIDGERIQTTVERALYVWGRPGDVGKYNKQLGSGLAKHGVSRMYKPFLANDVQLECPYFDPILLAKVVSIPADVMNEKGGKAAVMARVLRESLEKFGLDEPFIMRSKKIRMQDASENGEGGLTELLLAADCSQESAIEIFNEEFGSSMDPKLATQRLAVVCAGGSVE